MAAINLANPHTMSRIRMCKNHFSKMKRDIGMANYETRDCIPYLSCVERQRYVWPHNG